MLWNWLREQLEPHSSQVVEEGEKCITYEQLVCEAEQWDLASAPSKNLLPFGMECSSCVLFLLGGRKDGGSPACALWRNPLPPDY